MPSGNSSTRIPWLTAAWLAGFAFSLQTGIFLAQVFAGLGFVLALTGLVNGWIERPRYTLTHLLIAVTLVWLIVAAIASKSPLDGLQFLGNKFIIALLGFFAVYNLSSESGATRWFAPAVLIAGVFGALNGIIQYFFGVDLIYGQTIQMMPDNVVPYFLPVGLLDMALTYAGMQMMFFLLLLPWAWRKRGNRAIWIWLGMGLILLSIMLAFRRGPWMGLAGMLVLFLLTRERRVVIPTIFALIAVVGGLFIFADGFRARIMDAANLSTHSEQDRVLMWQAAWEMGQDNKITGIGPGQWRHEVESYVDMNHHFVSLAHPHSDPMYLLAVSGYPGLMLAALTVLSIVWLGFRLFWRAQDQPSTEIILAQGGILATGGLVVAGLTQCYLLDGENMIAMGMILGLTLSLAQVEPES